MSKLFSAFAAALFKTLMRSSEAAFGVFLRVRHVHGAQGERDGGHEDRQGEDQTLGDTLVDELALDPLDVTQAHEVDQLLERWIASLSKREREVLEGRFGLHNREPETLDMLSQRLGLTRERVRQVQNEALLKLKRHIGHRGITRDALM